MAAALHSLLCLLAGVGACWVLRRVLRQLFLTKADPSWVRKAA